MRPVPILEGGYYHVYNRGNQKQTLFYDKADFARFQFLLLYLQSQKSIDNTHRKIRTFLKEGTYRVSDTELKEISDSRFVNLVNYCIMPNHFHATVQSITDIGVSQYMHKVSNAYAKYFNTRYERSGHVFQGTYKAKIVDSDEQLAYLSAYIHRNPCELEGYTRNEISYPWSSYQDYKENRWGRLLNTDLLLSTFNDFRDYEYFVSTSGAKTNMFNT